VCGKGGVKMLPTLSWVQEILFEPIVVTVAKARWWKERDVNESKGVISVHLWRNMCSKDVSDYGVNSIYR
jgi:hypothetical protein